MTKSGRRLACFLSCIASGFGKHALPEGLHRIQSDRCGGRFRLWNRNLLMGRGFFMILSLVLVPIGVRIACSDDLWRWIWRTSSAFLDDAFDVSFDVLREASRMRFEKDWV